MLAVFAVSFILYPPILPLNMFKVSVAPAESDITALVDWLKNILCTVTSLLMMSDVANVDTVSESSAERVIFKLVICSVAVSLVFDMAINLPCAL